MDTFTAGSTITASFDFLDYGGNPVQASKLECVVTDVISGNELSRQSFTPSTESFVATLDEKASTLNDPTLEYEVHVITWFFQYKALINGVETDCEGSDQTCFKILQTSAQSSL